MVLCFCTGLICIQTNPAASLSSSRDASSSSDQAAETATPHPTPQLPSERSLRHSERKKVVHALLKYEFYFFASVGVDVECRLQPWLTCCFGRGGGRGRCDQSDCHPTQCVGLAHSVATSDSPSALHCISVSRKSSI